MKSVSIFKKNTFRILSCFIAIAMLLSVSVIQFQVQAKTIAGASTNIATIVSSGSVCAPEDNVWPDPGFENGDSFWASFVSQQSTLSISSEQAYFGSKSLKYSDPADWGGWGYAETHVTIKPNTDYTFACQILATDKIQNGMFQIEDGNTASRQVILQMQPDVLGVWQHFAFTFNSGDYAQLSLSLYAGGGTMYLDNMFLFESSKVVGTMSVVDNNPPKTSCSPADNIIANPSFEIDDSNWAAFIDPSAGKTYFTSDEAHTGNRSLIYTSPGSWGEWEYMLKQITVKADTNYVFTFWAKSPEYKQAFIGLMSDYGGVRTGDWKTFNGFSSDWKKYSVTFYTGSSVTLDIHLGAGGGVNYFDDFALFEESKAISISNPTIMSVNPDLKSAPSKNPEDNILQNPGFETAAAAGDWGTLNNNCSLVTDASNAHTGSSYLSYDAESAGAGSYVKEISGLSPFTVYTISCWMYGITEADGIGLAMDDIGTPMDLSGDLPGGSITFLRPVRFDKTWYHVGASFTTGGQTSVFLFITNSGGQFFVDDFFLGLATNAASLVPLTGEPSYVTDYLVRNSVGPAGQNNLLNTNSGAENTFAASDWGVEQFSGTGAITKSDEAAHSGTSSLKFMAVGETPAKRAIRWVTVEKNKDYMFTFWAKATTWNDICLNLIDDTNYKTIAASEELAASLVEKKWDPLIATNPRLMPSAYDNQWHQVAVAFNSGDQDKIGIMVSGTNGTMYLDDFNLCLTSFATAPEGPADQGIFCEVTDNDPAKTSCSEEDNLFENFNFEQPNIDFWSSVDGYGENVFVLTDSNDTQPNKVLKYIGSKIPDYSHYIKWIDVDPNTDYTFSAYTKGVDEGAVTFGLLDSNSSGPQNIGIELVPAWDNQWHLVSFTFNSNLYNRIGFYICNGGGEVMFENMRLFMSASGVDNDDNIIVPTPTTTNPQTGDISAQSTFPFAALLILALLSFIVIIKKHKQTDM